MSEQAPKNTEQASLEELVSRYEEVVRQAEKLVQTHVPSGEEESMIYRLGRFKMDNLQPLLGMVHFESGSGSQEDYGTSEAPLDAQADEKIMATIRDIEHRMRELEAQKKPKAA